MVASLVVCDWSGRRLDSIPRFTPESHRYAHDLLATTATDEPLRVSTFFATYYYHGNAGAFLNLVWPLSCGLVIRAFASGSHPWMRAMWTSVFLITIAAVLANTSRMAQLVALLLLVAICVQFGPLLLRKLSGGKSVALAGALAIGLALIAFAQASHFEQAA